ncbi:alpha/beta fold hydrolase [Salinicola halophilus]|uniref:alpha/beta fold hydrolase n=1 Tax=Salinicola halophilus TaxID=184065 RepID=UPI000DA2585A
MSSYGFLDLQSVRLVYRQSGDGPNVVLLHGFPDTLQTWTTCEQALNAHGYRTLNVSLRGYPPSSVATDGDYSIPTLAADVLSLLDNLEVDRAFILGHDWGASIAYALASIAPERCHALITLAVPPLSLFDSSNEERRVRPHNDYLARGAESASLLLADGMREVDTLYELWSPNWLPPHAHIAEVKRALAPPEVARATVDYYRYGLSDAERRQLFVPLNVPALIVYGDDEPAVRQRLFMRSQEAFAKPITLLSLARVGHWPHLEAPERFQSALNAFLIDYLLTDAAKSSL